MLTANAQNVYLGQRVVTSPHIESEICIIKRIDTDNEAVFVVPLNGSVGGWYSVATIISIN
tara:strand:- start:1198 stop:1380 length:183 start_codon:yes stop_codon:yes gene_type:complete